MHALTGRGSGVELTYNGFLWLDKPWPVAVGDGARRGAMVCFVSVRVATESDRKIDLSQRVSQHVLRVVGLASV